MTQVRIREVVGRISVVDGESLISPRLMERLMSAVLEARRACERDEAARRRDTQVGRRRCSEAQSHGNDRS